MSTVRPATRDIEQQDIDEAKAFNAQLEALIATQPLVYTLAPEVSRRLRREGKGIFPAPVFLEDAQDVEIAGRDGPIKLRLIRPDHKPTGIYLHIHGGGWTLGAHDMQDVGLKLLANETGLCAASIGYRLAPEHPYPAGPDDCDDAVLHLLEHGPALLDAPARFAIGGESAGAHLAVVTLLRLRDRHGEPDPVGRAQPGSFAADHPLVWDQLPPRRRLRAAARPRHLAPLRSSRRNAAGAVHSRHDGLPDGRFALHGRALARGRQPGRGRRLSRRSARFQRVPDRPGAKGKCQAVRVPA